LNWSKEGYAFCFIAITVGEQESLNKSDFFESAKYFGMYFEGSPIDSDEAMKFESVKIDLIFSS